MPRRCLVLNAGGSYHPDKRAAQLWAQREAAANESPDLDFVQEVPDEGWLEQWRSFGYGSLLGHRRGWTVRSDPDPAAGARLPVAHGAGPP